MLPAVLSRLLCGECEKRVQHAMQLHQYTPPVTCWLPTRYSLQDWAVTEELHSSSSSNEGSGHHAFYWELKEAAWATLQGAACCHRGGPMLQCNAAVGAAATSVRVLPQLLSAAFLHRACPPEAAPADASAQLAGWAAAVQRAMCACSQFYAALCAKRMLGPAELRLVRPGAFAQLREAAVRRGAAPEQCKPPVVVKREWERQLLESCRWQG